MNDTDAAFLKICDAALNGRRAPINDELPGRGASVTALTRAEKVRVEVFTHNFRRITVLAGACAGKSTADPPSGPHGAPKPHLIVEARGAFRHGSPVLMAGRKRSPPVTLPFKDGKRT